MSTPEKSDTHRDREAAQSVEQQVNEVVSQFEVAEDGSLSLPDGVEVDEAILFAAKAEKRRRDTQSSYTKNQQETKRLQKENELLASKWEEDAVAKLSASEQAELEELKTQDPDAWHNKLVSMKEEKQAKFQEKRKELSDTLTAEEELAMREEELQLFNEANPEVQITDDVIENDIPPRITKKLAEGKVTFGEFLDECKTYLGKGKKIAPTDKPDSSKDMSQMHGSREPSEEAKKLASKSDYKNEVY